MDGYFFLRYLKMLLQIFGGALPLLLSVLLPLNFMAGKGTGPVADTTDGHRWNVTGMDQLAWGNIRPENSNRYWAHFSMAVVTVAWVCFNFALECRHYITTQRRRMAPLVEPAPAMPSAPRCTELKTASPRSNDDSMAEAAGCTHSSTCRQFLTDKTHQQPRSSIKEKSTSTAVNPDLLYPSPDKCPCLAHQDTLDPITRSWWILYVREAAWHAAMMATLIVGAVLAVLSGILSQLSYFSPFRSWPSWLISALQESGFYSLDQFYAVSPKREFEGLDLSSLVVPPRKRQRVDSDLEASVPYWNWSGSSTAPDIFQASSKPQGLGSPFLTNGYPHGAHTGSLYLSQQSEGTVSVSHEVPEIIGPPEHMQGLGLTLTPDYEHQFAAGDDPTLHFRLGSPSIGPGETQLVPLMPDSVPSPTTEPYQDGVFVRNTPAPTILSEPPAYISLTLRVLTMRS
ncbi:late exocytosis, associated with Golgi transport-domain-containing protein [Aspergillus keveii]|uniref:Late exocytosis, associated with Golgi transport-domain-containing protein n=1 Tax=Aspergillus keveii TaxID=714993 RepID=A0ABR4FMJ8_9EURO